MANGHRAWKRQGDAFWRAHHEAWKRSDLNQRQYCEAHGLPQKAFENWRQKFRAEPQPSERKLLYRRRPLSPPLSPPVSPSLSPGTYPSSRLAGPIVSRPREGHRRRFSDGDKQWIIQEAAQLGASAAEVARRYGIAQRVLRRWKQELAAASAPTFVTIQITDADASSDAAPTLEGAMS
jgi:transposase-like protein